MWRSFRMQQRGLSLVETIVILGIVSSLATISVVGISEIRQKGRDTQRIHDLDQIRVALRLYVDEVGSYPDCDSGMVIGEGVVTPLGCTTNIDTLLATYLAGVTTDPLGPDSSTYDYFYDSDFDCAGASSKIVLFARTMERTGAANWTSICTPPDDGGTSAMTYGVILR